MSIADSIFSMSNVLTTLATLPTPAVFQAPGTDISRYESEEGPSAVSLMSDELYAVGSNSEPELGAPTGTYMEIPTLDLQPITDLTNSSIVIGDSLPGMPSIPVEIPDMLGDALSAATSAYSEVSGALASALPMLAALPSMISELEQLPGLVMNEVGAQLAESINEALDAVGLLNPIESAAILGIQINQVYSALSLIANGQVSSPSMLVDLGNALSKGSVLSPKLAEVAGVVLNQASVVASALAPITEALDLVSASVWVIKNVVSNPLLMTPELLTSAVTQASDSLSFAVNSLVV